jgi:cardiolipin synthase
LRQFPHLITLLRVILAPLLAWLIVQSDFRAALGLVGVAGVTDWLDGYAARKLGVTGRLGVILDPLADKLMLVTLFFALAYARLIPLWLLALVMGRDAVIVGGALLVRTYRNIHKFPPLTIGKVSTFFQIVFALLALLYAAAPFPFIRWLEILALFLTTLFTTLSGIQYVRLGIRMARRLVV